MSEAASVQLGAELPKALLCTRAATVRRYFLTAGYLGRVPGLLCPF